MGNPLLSPTPVVVDVGAGLGYKLDAVLVLKTRGYAVANTAGNLEEVEAVAYVEIGYVVSAATVEQTAVVGIKTQYPVNLVVGKFLHIGFEGLVGGDIGKGTGGGCQGALTGTLTLPPACRFAVVGIEELHLTIALHVLYELTCIAEGVVDLLCDGDLITHNLFADVHKVLLVI